jgi:hypothetical protein
VSREWPGGGSPGSYRRGGDPLADCAFRSVDDPGVIAAVLDRPVEAVPPSPEGWWLVLCGDGRSVGAELVYVWPRSAALPPAVRDRLVDAAIDALEVPYLAPHTSPEGTPDQPLITGLDTWVWVDPAAWTPVTARAAIPAAAVTATATPVSLTWRPGDDSPPRACPGPGRPWSGTTAPDATCGHRYQRTSRQAPDGVWPLTVTVTWEVTWTCAPACGAGRAEPFVLGVVRRVTVEQIQTRLTT